MSSPSIPASVPSDTPHAMDITIHAFLIRGRIVWATLGICAGFTAMMTRVGRLQRVGRVLDGGDTVRLRNISTANLQQLVDGDVLCLRNVVVQQTTKDPLAHRAAAAEYDLLVAHE